MTGELDQAIAAFRQAIALNPKFPDAYSNLGGALNEKGDLDEAIAAFRQAIALNPNLPEAHGNLGSVLKNRGEPDETIAACRAALILKPNYPEACVNLGAALKDKGELDAAIAAFRQAIVLNPNSPEAHGSLADVLKDVGQLDEAIAAYRQAIALKPVFPEAHDNLLYTLHFHPAYDARAIADEHVRWNREFAEPLKKLIQAHVNDRSPNRRLRIGYFSPDFRGHPVGRFVFPLLAHHDKSQCEVFAYANVRVLDPITQRIRSYVDNWRDIVGLSDAQVVDLIREDQIDILVDLTMHMADNRLLVFARKPAPVQVTYLAYCSTTGLETIDYRLSDPYLDPPTEDELPYSEQTIRLPETYWCYQPVIESPESIPLPALRQDAITFGCLNNFCKVNETGLMTWAAILRAVPNSQLLLHAHEGSHRQQVSERFERHGIKPDRVHFVPYASPDEYFDLYRRMDIALDTFPYGGGTTTCDALWMGVPVVSLAGKMAVGRGGLSILSNIGLPELVGRSEDEYVRIATGLAGDLPRLANLRSTLRRRMQQSPLMDAKRFSRNVEAAYRQMWRNWCASVANT